MAEKKHALDVSPNVMMNGALLVGGAIALYLAWPTLRNLFKTAENLTDIPNAILEAPRKALDTLRKSAKDSSVPSSANQLTTVPGVSLDTLMKYVDKPVYAKADKVAMRKSAHSNAALVKDLKRGEKAGVVYSVVNETLKDRNKAWLAIADAPYGSVFAFVPMDSVTTDKGAITGIGCKCSRSGKGVSGLKNIYVN